MANDPTIFHRSTPIRHREDVADHHTSEVGESLQKHEIDKSDHFTKSDKLLKEAFIKQQGNLAMRLANANTEGSFEALAKAVLYGEHTLPEAPTGKMILSSKTSEGWKTFFKNMLGMGNAETAVKTSLGGIANAFFRGLFPQETDNSKMTLVSDLHLKNADQIMTDKFSRILIENPDILNQLSKLSPGDEIPQSLLNLFGSDITYLQLTHLPDILNDAAKLAAREGAMAHYKNTVNVGAFTRMADALIRERKKDDGKAGDLTRTLGDSQAYRPWHYFMSADPRWDRQERFGKPKFWLFFSYSIGAILSAIVLYWLFREL